MDETLREVIEYHVREGYELATFTSPRATLVRGGEVVRLRLEGRWVRFEQAAEPAAGPAAVAARGAWAAGWLAFERGGAAAVAAAALVLIAFAVLLDDGAPSTVATPVPTLPPAPTLPTATATPTPTPMATATPTQTPPATPRATPPALITALVVRDQLLGPAADRGRGSGPRRAVLRRRLRGGRVHVRVAARRQRAPRCRDAHPHPGPTAASGGGRQGTLGRATRRAERQHELRRPGRRRAADRGGDGGARGRRGRSRRASRSWSAPRHRPSPEAEPCSASRAPSRMPCWRCSPRRRRSPR